MDTLGSIVRWAQTVVQLVSSPTARPSVSQASPNATRREAVLWDSLEPGSLDQAVAWLRTQGREPFLLMERWEEPLFRERFGGPFRARQSRLAAPLRDRSAGQDLRPGAIAPRISRDRSIPTQYIWPW